MADDNRGQKKSEMLIEMGRATGAQLMMSAVTNAENKIQMNNQMFVCENAAIHILATIALNEHIQDGVSIEYAMKSIVKTILIEIDFLHKCHSGGELEKIKPPNSSNLEVVPDGN